jgi:hypothetical protein
MERRGKKGSLKKPYIKHPVCFLILAGWILCYAGCIGGAPKNGMPRENAVFTEKILAQYLSKGDGGLTTLKEIALKDGKTGITITTDSMPNIQLYGSAPNRDGVFYLHSLYFLDSHIHGWIEFTLDIRGKGFFKVWKNYGVLEIEPDLEMLDILEGKIRYTHSAISGSQAVRALENRRGRITLLTQWMRGFPGVPEFKNQWAFSRHWFPLLFPELVSPWARPPLWKTETAVWNQIDDIRWNETYTEAAFPPELKPLRNSGTLFRDWEEALGWIYLFYKWDRLVESLGEVYLSKRKTIEGTLETPVE